MTDGAKKTIIYGTIGMVGLTIAYAIFSLRKQIGLLKKMKVGFAGISTLPTSGGEVGLNVGLSLKNESAIKVVTSNINIDIYLNGVFVNKVIEKTPQTINGNATSVIRFNLFFNPIDVIKNVKIEDIVKVLDFKGIVLNIKGYVSGSVDGINVENVPFELKETIGNLMGGK